MRTFSLLFFAVLFFFSSEARTSKPEKLEVGYLGIYSEKVSRTKAQVLGFDNIYGSYITKVIAGTPAQQAGLQVFDYIYGIDNERTSSSEDLNDLLRAFEPGQTVILHFVRKRQERMIQIELGSRKKYQVAVTIDRKEAFLGVSDACSCPVNEIGIKVEIIRNSTAEAIGLRDGDIITAINGYPIYDMDDISTILDNELPGTRISIQYKREDYERTASGTLKSYEATRSESKQQSSSPAFLGVFSKSVSNKKAQKLGYDNNQGLYISQIIPQTAAEAANLKVFDYIFGVDEYRCGQGQTLSQILRKYRAGETATLHFMRNGQPQRTTIKFGKRIDYDSPSLPPCEDPFLGVRPNYRNYTPEGVQIEVVKGATAQALGLKDKDVILKINGKTMIDWDDISIMLDNMKVGQEITVTYLQEGQKKTNSQPLGSGCDSESTDRINFRGKILRKTEAIKEGKSQSAIIFIPSRDNIAELVVSMAPAEADDIRTFNANRNTSIPIDNQLNVEDLKIVFTKDADLYKLVFNLPTRGNTTVKIYNKKGRAIYGYELAGFLGEFEDTITLVADQSNDYYLIIKQEDRSITQKITLIRK